MTVRSNTTMPDSYSTIPTAGAKSVELKRKMRSQRINASLGKVDGIAVMLRQLGNKVRSKVNILNNVMNLQNKLHNLVLTYIHVD